jgi:hypothetical protein
MGDGMRLRVAALITICMGSPAWAKCHFDPFKTYFDGAQSSSAGTADSGKACEIHFHGTITSIDVSGPAQHGSASWNGSLGENRVIYKSNAAYKGADSFTLAIHGTHRGVEGVSTVTVNMDVQ